jgi:hypothetical protein
VYVSIVNDAATFSTKPAPSATVDFLAVYDNGATKIPVYGPTPAHAARRAQQVFGEVTDWIEDLSGARY